MNEFLFFIHIAVIVFFLLFSVKLGKEALLSWTVLQVILGNLFVVKQMTFMNLHITCSDMYIVGNILGLNILQEYYGRKVAQTTTWISFFSMVFFILMAKIHLFYIPNSYDQTQGAFSLILSQTPRIFLASLSTFFIVQRFDLFFFEFIKKVFANRSLMARSVICMVSSQILDTLLFSFLGLYGVVGSLLDVIAAALCIKLLVIGLISPAIALTKMLIPPPVKA